VIDDGWWTGIVAYNPSVLPCTITIAPYSAQGTALSSSSIPIAGMGKYVGAVSQLGLPAQTAWFKIDSTRPLSGFELFGAVDSSRLAAYAAGGSTGTLVGVFPKIEKNGWTGIVFVNTEAVTASVILTAYDDNGTAMATRTLTVGGHAKVVNAPEEIFSQDISSATYIGYSADRNVVGLQLNGSADGTMFDVLPGLAGGASLPTTGSMRVTNNTGFIIEDLYISPSSSSSWGTDQLEGNIISNGPSVILTNILPGSYNVKAVLSNLTVLYHLSVNVVAGSTVSIEFP